MVYLAREDQENLSTEEIEAHRKWTTDNVVWYVAMVCGALLISSAWWMIVG